MVNVGSTDSTTLAPSRVAWVDIAKTMAILLVVIYHVSTWFVWEVLPESAGSSGVRVWADLSAALIPVRIPLFFLVSGLLAVRAVERPWRLLVRTRFTSLLWPFALWTLLIALPWSSRTYPDDPLINAEGVASSLLLGGTHFWYLPALVIVTSVAKLVRRVSLVAIVAAATVNLWVTANLNQFVGVMGPYLGINLDRWLLCLLWFMVGCFLPAIARRISRLNALWALVGVATFIGIRGLLVLDAAYATVVAALTVTGMATLIVISGVLSRWAPMRRTGAFIAARTLPIYVTHAFLLELLAVGARLLRERGWTPPHSGWVGALFVPLVFVVVVTASVGLHGLSRWGHFRWLFEPPARLLPAPVGGQASR
jgi:uncharacterized membrane protein YcfT